MSQFLDLSASYRSYVQFVKALKLHTLRICIFFCMLRYASVKSLKSKKTRDADSKTCSDLPKVSGRGQPKCKPCDSQVVLSARYIQLPYLLSLLIISFCSISYFSFNHQQIKYSASSSEYACNTTLKRLVLHVDLILHTCNNIYPYNSQASFQQRDPNAFH